jgi:hypothetical protein
MPTIFRVIQEPTGDPDKSMIARSVVFEADLDTDTVEDFVLGEERDLQGMAVEVANFTDGDHLRIEVVLLGTPDTVLRVLAEGPSDGGVFIPPSGIVSVIAEGVATIPTGIALRFTYHSVATSGSKPKLYILLRQWK